MIEVISFTVYSIDSGYFTKLISVKNYFYGNAKLCQNIPDYSGKCQ